MPRVNKATPRARKAGDDTYIARRRYVRSAERYLKQAGESTGATAARLKNLARESYNKALSTYSGTKQQVSGKIQAIGEQLGASTRKIETTREQRADLVRESFQTLETVRSQDLFRTEREAEAVITSPEISHRIIGGLVDVWKTRVPSMGGKLDTKRIMPTLFDYFGVSTYQELLEKIEGIVGERLYEMQESELGCDTVKLVLQDYATSNVISAQ